MTSRRSNSSYESLCPVHKITYMLFLYTLVSIHVMSVVKICLPLRLILEILTGTTTDSAQQIFWAYLSYSRMAASQYSRLAQKPYHY